MSYELLIMTITVLTLATEPDSCSTQLKILHRLGDATKFIHLIPSLPRPVHTHDSNKSALVCVPDCVDAESG